MIVICTSCSSRFQYDETRFQGATSKRFRCPKCSTVFDVMNPGTPRVSDPIRLEELPAPPNLTQPFTAPGEALTTERREREDAFAASGMKDTLPPGMRFSLALLSGPNASTVRTLEQPVTIIGREEGDILTQDPETSRRHARLEIHWDGSVWLTDLGSTNGTFIDGKPVLGTVHLQDRQEFSCGKSAFMLLVRREDTVLD